MSDRKTLTFNWSGSHQLTAGVSSLLFSPPPGEGASQNTGPSQGGRDLEAMTQARVDIRKLQQFLIGQQVNPTKAMCSECRQLIGRFKMIHDPSLLMAEGLNQGRGVAKLFD